MKTLKDYIQESVLGSNFNPKEDRVKFAAAVNTLKNLLKLKYTKTVKELTRALGKPLSPQKAKVEIKNDAYKNGCTILRIPEFISTKEPTRCYIYFYGVDMDTQRYGSTLAIPIFAEDLETPVKPTYRDGNRTSNKISFSTGFRYWIFGPDNDEQLAELGEYLMGQLPTAQELK